MGLELKRGLELFFKNFETKLSLILFLCFLRFSFPSVVVERTFVALSFAHLMTQKSLNLDME